MCAFTTEYLDLIDCNYTTELYDAVVRCTSILFVYKNFCCCCCVLLILLLLLQHAAAVRHRVPDGNICCCGSLHLIPVFSFIQTQFTFNARTLAVLSRLQPRFTYNTHNIYTSLVITGMRGAKAGVSPPRRSPCFTAAVCTRCENFVLEYLQQYREHSTAHASQ